MSRRASEIRELSKRIESLATKQKLELLEGKYSRGSNSERHPEPTALMRRRRQP